MSPASASEADYYRLRTEWLRFKSHLYDSITGLPALPAILEDVRRILEARHALDVVYFDLGRSGWHETKLGWAAYDQAVRDFARLLLAMHILGGAVMGRDRTEGVIDSDNRVFGYKNMYVCDGSVVSANPAVNPSLTIAAIAERAMSRVPAKGR